MPAWSWNHSWAGPFVSNGSRAGFFIPLTALLAAAVSAMPVEYVQQRAGEEKQKGQELHNVGAVLCEQEISGDQDETQEHPAACPGAARIVVLMRMLSHVSLQVMPADARRRNAGRAR
jgi:hypothetical protein